ncbi:hypothetical protein FQN50_007156 [Emmonsiellopsis sp. PD_5]|nr:hypothetical protein FQN50_007156 [Emmonsiellopsis sp. PD_5]
MVNEGESFIYEGTEFVMASGPPPANLLADCPPKELQASISRLYKNDMYSDLTIVCGTKTFKVHRCIMCPRSGFFKAACDGRFREATSGVINLHEEPVLVDKMIQYLYTLRYTFNARDAEIAQNSPFAYAGDCSSETAEAETKSVAADEAHDNEDAQEADNDEGAQEADHDEDDREPDIIIEDEEPNTNDVEIDPIPNFHHYSISDPGLAAAAAAASAAANTPGAPLTFYKYKIPERAITSSAPLGDTISFHILMYGLADRLMIASLKQYTKHQLRTELHRSTGLDEFRRAVTEVYETTPEHEVGLKHLVVSVAVNKLPAYRHPAPGEEMVLADDWLKTVPGFMADLLSALMDMRVDQVWGSWGMHGGLEARFNVAAARPPGAAMPESLWE